MAGPGFLNFKMNKKTWQKTINSILGNQKKNTDQIKSKKNII